MTTARKKPSVESQFNAKRLDALKNLRALYVEETKLCVALTGGRTLTETELKAKENDKEFQTLIEIPLKNKEPLYIMPEFDEKNAKEETLHPALKPIVEGIKAGRPYHEFMPKHYGEAWPLLLRLYYGLKDGFKISIEQLQSMMKIPYWCADKLDTQCVPILNADQTALSAYGKVLLREALQISDQDIEKYIASLKEHPEIPEGEKHVQVVRLDPKFSRMAFHVLKREELKEKDKKSYILRMKFEQYDKKTIVPVLGKYSSNGIVPFIQANKGLEFFCELFTVRTGLGPCQVFMDDKGPFIVNAPSTLLKNLHHYSQYQGRISYAPRLGKLNMQHMEAHNDKFQRAGNLIAPGVSNPEISHRCVITPGTSVAHDEFHLLTQLLTSPKVGARILHLKNLFRQYFDPTKTQFTSEITRCIEREVHYPDFSNLPMSFTIDDIRLVDILKSVFEKSLTSSIVLMTDILLSPDQWPIKIAKYLISAYTLFKSEKFEDLQTTAQAFAAKTNNNHPFVCLLLLCQYMLKDSLFCNMIESLKNPNDYFAWRKDEDGYMYPVMIFGDKEYTFEQLLKLSSVERCLLFLHANKKVSATVSATAVTAADEKADSKSYNGESAPVVCKRKVTVYIPDFTDKKRAIIEKLKGTMKDSKNDLTAVRLSSFLLDKSICAELGIDRITLHIPIELMEERLVKLSSLKGLTAERMGDELFQFTFPVALKKEIDPLIQEWKEADSVKKSLLTHAA